MSLSGYTTAVERSARGELVLWLEIEGLAYAYGTHAKDSTWFSGRASGAQFSGVRSWMELGSIPSLPPQELDHLEGSVSGGALVFKVVDQDGSLTALTANARTDGWAVFSSNTNATATGAQTVTGDTSTWDASGVAYVGYETFAYSAKTSTSVTISARGRYRSRATTHEGGKVDAVTASNGSMRIDVGTLITPYPRKLEGRRVWLFAGHSPTAETDCTEVWSGVIEEVGFEGASLGTLVLSCSQAFGELKQPLFPDLGWFGIPEEERVNLEPVWVLASRTQAAPQTFTEGETYQFGSYPTGHVISTGQTSRRHFMADGWHILKLGASFDVATNITVTSIDDRWEPVRPDQSRPAEPGGSIGSFIREVVLIDDTEGPFATKGVHPLQVLLQVLTSDQGGSVNGDYDVLPPGFGLGMDEGRIDVTGIEALIAATPGLRVSCVIDRPVEDAGKWIRETLLKPFGFYLRPSLANLLSVGRMGAASPEDRSAAVTIDTSPDIVALAAWRRDVLSAVGLVRWKLNQRPTEDGIRSVDTLTARIVRDGRAVLLDHPKARTIEVDAGAVVDAPTVLAEYTAQVAARFSRPVAEVDLVVDLRHAVREVGEFVFLTHSRIPSPSSATRGVSADLWEIIGKRLDYARASVSLTLRRTAVADLGTRYFAPAMLVDGAPAGNDVTVDQTSYVAAGQDSTDAFAVGDYVRGYTIDLVNRTTAREITAISGAVVTLNSAAGIGDGDVLMHADYGDWDADGTSVGSVIAFRAAADRTLTDDEANADDPHEYG